MKNHCTFKTSLALKAAGFPQPDKDIGQVWYSVDGDEMVFGPDQRLHTIEEYGFYEDAKEVKGHIYAPSPSDLLEQLGWEWNLHQETETTFSCDNAVVSNPMFGPDKRFEHDNPAEACAAAWLELKKEKV